MEPMREKPFPWKCGNCREKAVTRATVPYSVDVRHDWDVHHVTIPDLVVPKCENCGELILDDLANERISHEFRETAGLLQPSDIHRHREALNLTQRELAARLGVSELMLAAWERGGIFQPKGYDLVLRLFFHLPEVRDALKDPANGAELLHRQRVAS
jgi:DNA-binding transcriptional regulator YiaG